MKHSTDFLAKVSAIALAIPVDTVENMVDQLVALRLRRGRLFILGVGGSAGNAGHAVNDFRKLCGIEAYAPTDNVSELTARANDEGWNTIFSAWLSVSQLSANDAILIFSVGGGNLEKNVSPNIVTAINEAKARGAAVFGIVGRADGYTAKVGDVVIVIPTVDPGLVTPLSEGFQAIVWHCIVSNPKLAVRSTKWEGLVSGA
jgi:D-sedoheptulose 7-phosphate isomerase